MTPAQSAKLRFSLRRKHASKEIKIYKLCISNEGVKYLCSHWTDVGHHFQNTVAALAESSAYSYWANQAVFKRKDRLTLLVITPTKCCWRKVALPILQTPKKGLFSLVRSQMGWCVFGSISLSISIWPSYEWEQHDAYKNLYKSTITSQIQPGIPRTISLAMEIFWVISPCKNSKRNTDDWQQKPYGELMIALCMPPLVADELTKLLSTTFNITIPLTLVQLHKQPPLIHSPVTFVPPTA